MRELYPQARKLIIEAFRAAPNRWWTEKLIISTADDSTVETIPPESMRAAIDWQTSQGNLERRKNPETETFEWRLTNEGRDRLGV